MWRWRCGARSWKKLSRGGITTLLPNKIEPKANKKVNKRTNKRWRRPFPTLLLPLLLLLLLLLLSMKSSIFLLFETKKKNRPLNDNYNPYLSAERQMAELFNDAGEVRRPATRALPVQAPIKPEETTSIEQLEEDLKSIFSEISQLGKSNESPPRELAPPTSTPCRSGAEVEKQLSKFCHACGSAYPERYPVKYCCQCGERRLNLWSSLRGRGDTLKILWGFFEILWDILWHLLGILLGLSSPWWPSSKMFKNGRGILRDCSRFLMGSLNSFGGSSWILWESFRIICHSYTISMDPELLVRFFRTLKILWRSFEILWPSWTLLDSLRLFNVLKGIKSTWKANCLHNKNWWDFWPWLTIDI